MNKDNGLLARIAKELNITQGIEETVSSFRSRVIYSAIGHVTYGSLFDPMDGGQPISIVHFKNRCKDLFSSYKAIYPEIISSWEFSDDEFADLVYDLFLRTGSILHCPNRLLLPFPRKTTCKDIVFLRGFSLSTFVYRSGLGPYRIQQTTDNQNDNLMTMFHMSREPLQKRWSHVINEAKWHIMDFSSQDIEYLRIDPPFSKGYFTDRLTHENTPTIARFGIGYKEYYLCRKKGEIVEYSPLSPWQTNNRKYSELANSCLAYNGTLPSIKIHKDGNIIIVNLSYLLPPSEQNFLEFYSWPYEMNSNNMSFTRILPVKIFDVFREKLEDVGYTFTEV